MDHLIFAPRPDARVAALEKLFSDHGKRVAVKRRASGRARKNPVYAIFPFAIPEDELLAFLGTLAPRSVCFGGHLPDAALPRIRQGAFIWIDLLVQKRFQAENSALTAEGAMSVFLRESPRALRDSTIALTGSGALARACAERFSQNGAKIVILARNKEARNKARKRGYLALHLPLKRKERKVLRRCDALFNTVPAKGILSSVLLSSFSSEARLYDLASGAENADPAYTLRVQKLPALPARACPESAARILFSAIRKTEKQLEKRKDAL